jgi:plastocyanin
MARRAARLLAMIGLFTLLLPGTARADEGVTIQNIGYHPDRIEVPVGTTVTWTNLDSVRHSVTSDTPGEFNSSPGCPTVQSTCIGPNQSFTHTFDLVGDFSYHCEVHPQVMFGTVRVVPLVTTTSEVVTTTTTPPATTVPRPTTTRVTITPPQTSSFVTVTTTDLSSGFNGPGGSTTTVTGQAAGPAKPSGSGRGGTVALIAVLTVLVAGALFFTAYRLVKGAPT